VSGAQAAAGSAEALLLLLRERHAEYTRRVPATHLPFEFIGLSHDGSDVYSAACSACIELLKALLEGQVQQNGVNAVHLAFEAARGASIIYRVPNLKARQFA